MAIRVDIPELGADQFVEIKDPKFLPWGVQKEITAMVSGKGSDVETSAQLDVAERIAMAIIKGGNVVDEDNVPFTFPLTEESVKLIPSVVIERVTTKFAELKGQKVDTKNS